MLEEQGIAPTVMGWKERGWFLGKHGSELFDRNGNAGPTVWANGRVVGGWTQTANGEIRVELLERLDAPLAPSRGCAYRGRVETWDALRARRNVRTYMDRRIPGEDLERILEAARRTPSSMNQQAWDLVVVTDRDRLRELSRTWRFAVHVASSAATVALVIPATRDRDERDILWYDLGQVTMSIMLAAADLGVGSSHASVGDQTLARRVLGLPETRECAMLVALGYPADRPLRPVVRPERRAFEDIVHREGW